MYYFIYIVICIKNIIIHSKQNKSFNILLVIEVILIRLIWSNHIYN